MSNERREILSIEPKISTKSINIVATYLVGFFDICRFYHLFGKELFSPAFYMLVEYTAYRVYLSLSNKYNPCQGMPLMQRVHIISESVFMQKETLHRVIINQAFLMVFQSFFDCCDSLQQWANLQWKIVKDEAKFVDLKFEVGTS